MVFRYRGVPLLGFATLRFAFFGFPSFNSSCGFGGIRTRAPIRRFVFSNSSDFFMADNPRKEERERAALELKVARADAIHAYAGVEQALSLVLAAFLGATPTQASIIFFNIIASRSRDKILEGLLKEKFGKTYDTYWYGVEGQPGVKSVPGMSALLQQLATTRNFIVHWTIAVNIGEGPITEELIPPTIWHLVDDRRSLSVQDLNAFRAKADFVWRSLNMFQLLISGIWPDAPDAWREIFQQPCTYPPSDGHPLGQK